MSKGGGRKYLFVQRQWSAIRHLLLSSWMFVNSLERENAEKFILECTALWLSRQGIFSPSNQICYTTCLLFIEASVLLLPNIATLQPLSFYHQVTHLRQSLRHHALFEWRKIETQSFFLGRYRIIITP